MSELILETYVPAPPAPARMVPQEAERARNVHALSDACPHEVSSDELARFIRDPLSFASRAGAPQPQDFIKAYLQSLDRRLSRTMGERAGASHRLATLSADALIGLPTGYQSETAEPDADPAAPFPLTFPDGDLPDGLDLSPRMGPVMVACAVVTAVTAVVQCAVAISMCLAKHSNA